MADLDIDNGGPVFPGEQIAFTASGHRMTLGHHNGMSLRAWLAGQAMNGLLAADLGVEMTAAIAKQAVAQADALLAELEKPRG